MKVYKYSIVDPQEKKIRIFINVVLGAADDVWWCFLNMTVFLMTFVIIFLPNKLKAFDFLFVISGPTRNRFSFKILEHFKTFEYYILKFKGVFSLISWKVSIESYYIPYTYIYNELKAYFLIFIGFVRMIFHLEKLENS